MQQKKPNQDSLALLRQAIKDFMPVLNQNLSAAYSDYMNGNIPNGAYQYVLSRYTNAAIIASGEEKIDPMKAFMVGAVLFIDLPRGGIQDIKKPKQQELANKKLEKLRELYNDNGFTENHVIGNIPIRPLEELTV
jgi:hypothetical protein